MAVFDDEVLDNLHEELMLVFEKYGFDKTLEVINWSMSSYVNKISNQI